MTQSINTTYKKRQKNRFGSMMNVDFRRMFTTPLFYIMLGIAIVVPILILTMTTSVGGSDATDPSTVSMSFTNVWQIIGTAGGADVSNTTQMDMTSMCNINLIFFAAAVLVCMFVADDFRSGYAKNLFTIRAKKSDYVLSKTFVCLVASMLMLVGFFAGSMIGGGIAGLSFELIGANMGNVIMCLVSKMFLMGVFVAIFLVVAVLAKQKLWLSILLSLGVGMLLFMMVPMITPLNAGMMNVILCLAGAGIFSIGLGAVSTLILKKTSLV